ncbi:orotate phosphoribosyltransferase [Hypnocyclicus thermotrophus]|uniref:Orotate phosphoribosyltransferase n=1 Tax=Hypnocyclicus thermotrophus TaxID=1627895 RepID=A0AA46I4T8_9FUSO|nr:orotate phosphoribosyltransferase [Hypnocyclicus thermotrophus]
MNKNIARHLLEKEAVRLNVKEPFIFVSGIKSPIYCDNRKMIAFPKERGEIVNTFIDLLKDKEYDVIAGTATAGIPWASFIADRINKPMAYIRSKKKAHGAGKQIEGAEVKGKKVIVIEDLISTGGSCITAVEACKGEGASEVEVAAIFSYEFKKAFDNFKRINTNFETITNFSTLLEVAKEDKFITEEELNIAKTWNIDPENWGK